MAPLLLLSMAMVFIEIIEKGCIKEGLTMIQLQQKMNSPCDTGQLTGHKRKTFAKGSLLHLFFILYVNTGASPL